MEARALDEERVMISIMISTGGDLAPSLGGRKIFSPNDVLF